MARFAPLRTDDKDLARVQDELARLLNPILALNWHDRLSLNGTDNQENGECWVDVFPSIVGGSGGAALTQNAFPDGAASFQSLFMAHNTNDALSLTTQMPHGWNLGRVRPHMHVTPCSAPASTEFARLVISYAWQNPGAPIPASSAWTSVAVLLPVTSADNGRHLIVDFGLVNPPPGARASTLLRWYVSRTGTDPGDTYTTNKAWGSGAANLEIGSADVHCQLSRAGSTPEFPER